MSGKERDTITSSGEPWKDPDDAPELDDAFFERADLYVGDVLIRQGRGSTAEVRTVETSIALSADVLARFQGSGPDWQEQIDRALKEWLAEHPGKP